MLLSRRPEVNVHGDARVQSRDFVSEEATRGFTLTLYIPWKTCGSCVWLYTL